MAFPVVPVVTGLLGLFGRRKSNDGGAAQYQAEARTLGNTYTQDAQRARRDQSVYSNRFDQSADQYERDLRRPLGTDPEVQNEIGNAQEGIDRGAARARARQARSLGTVGASSASIGANTAIDAAAMSDSARLRRTVAQANFQRRQQNRAQIVQLLAQRLARSDNQLGQARSGQFSALQLGSGIGQQRAQQSRYDQQFDLGNLGNLLGGLAENYDDYAARPRDDGREPRNVQQGFVG